MYNSPVRWRGWLVGTKRKEPSILTCFHSQGVPFPPQKRQVRPWKWLFTAPLEVLVVWLKSASTHKHYLQHLNQPPTPSTQTHTHILLILNCKIAMLQCSLTHLCCQRPVQKCLNNFYWQVIIYQHHIVEKLINDINKLSSKVKQEHCTGEDKKWAPWLLWSSVLMLLWWLLLILLGLMDMWQRESDTEGFSLWKMSCHLTP